MKDEISFEITNQATEYRILKIEPLALQFGLDAGESCTLAVYGKDPYQMYLGDNDEEICIEIDGDVTFKIFYEGEEVKSGHNIRF